MQAIKSEIWLPVVMTLTGTIMVGQSLAVVAANEVDQFRTKPIGYRAAPKSQTSEAGLLIFQKKNCQECHTVDVNGKDSGGCLGPVLSGIGGRRNSKFILDRISAEASDQQEFNELYGQAELMPHPRMPYKQAQLVVSYLMTLPEPKNGFSIKGHALGTSDLSEAKDRVENEQEPKQIDPKSIAKGKKLFYDAGCMSCHTIKNMGGQFASALDDVAVRKGRAYIKQRMTSAEFLQLGTNDEYNERGTQMPPSALTPTEINSITDFLMSLSSSKQSI